MLIIGELACASGNLCYVTLNSLNAVYAWMFCFTSKFFNFYFYFLIRIWFCKYKRLKKHEYYVRSAMLGARPSPGEEPGCVFTGTFEENSFLFAIFAQDEFKRSWFALVESSHFILTNHQVFCATYVLDTVRLLFCSNYRSYQRKLSCYTWR